MGETRVAPEDATGRRQRQYEDEPKPEEDVEYLVYEVDGYGALDRIAVHIFAHGSYDEVAHGYARETMGGRPVLSLDHSGHGLEPVHGVIGLEEKIQQDYL